MDRPPNIKRGICSNHLTVVNHHSKDVYLTLCIWHEYAVSLMLDWASGVLTCCTTLDHVTYFIRIVKIESFSNWIK